MLRLDGNRETAIRGAKQIGIKIGETISIAITGNGEWHEHKKGDGRWHNDIYEVTRTSYDGYDVKKHHGDDY